MSFQYLSTAIASLSVINCATHYGWTSSSLLQLSQNNSHIQITSDDEYWISVSFFGGNLIASVCAAFVVNLLGQKNGIILSSILSLIAWIIIGCAQSVGELIIARICGGAGDGILLCALPIYLAETSQASIRGLLLSSIMVSGAVGILIENIIGTFTSFKLTAAITALLPFFTIISLFFISESPYRLVSKGKIQKAKTVLQKLRNTEFVDEELERISSMIYNKKLSVNSFLDLFSNVYNRKTVYICFTLITIHILSGNIPFIFHTQHIFQDAGGPLSSWASSLIYISVQLLFTVVGVAIVDKFGRRPLLLISTIGVAIILFIEFIYFYLRDVLNYNTENFNFLPLVGLLSFLVVYSIGLLIVPSVIAGEIFAPNVKFVALSLYQGYFCVFNVIVLKIFDFCFENYGIYFPFLVFAVSNFFGFVFIYYFVPETMQKTLEDIQREIVNKIEYCEPKEEKSRL